MIGALVGYLVGCLKHRRMSVMMILQLEHTKKCKRSTKGLTVLVGLGVGLGVLATGGFVGVGSFFGSCLCCCMWPTLTLPFNHVLLSTPLTS